jgi:hypothetical protein
LPSARLPVKVHLGLLPPRVLVNLFIIAKGGVLDMLESIIKDICVINIIRLIIKNNLFVSHIKIKLKFLGLDMEMESKEKKHPSLND